jgi:DNA-binding CsgD family transcriptional regulator
MSDSIKLMLDLSDLIHSPTETSFEQQVCYWVGMLGFDCHIFGIELVLPDGQRVRHVINSCPVAWQETYAARRFMELDPTVLHCRTKDQPLVWGERPDADAAEFWQEARGHGIGFGFSIPLRLNHNTVGWLSLARDRPLPAEPTELGRLIDVGRVLAVCAQTAAARLLLPSLVRREGIALSKREKQCLALAAGGAPSSEIAEKLHISEPTVMFHFKKVVSKLGVRNRNHAVAMCLALDLIG